MVNVYAKLIEQILHHREMTKALVMLNSSLLLIIIIKLGIFATISKKPFHMDGPMIIA